VKLRTVTAASAHASTVTSAQPHAEWDDFVAGLPGGDLVQTTAWAASKQGLGLQARLAVVRERGAIAGGGLLIVKRIAPRVAAAYVARGPIAHQSHPWASTVALDALIREARALATRFLIVQPPEHAPHLDDVLDRRGFARSAPKVAPDATIRLDLRSSDDELLRSMSSMRRRNVRRALTEELEVVQTDDLGVFHRLHALTAKRQGFTALSLDYLHAQWRHLGGDRDGLALFVARHRGAPVAALWLTRFGDTVTFRLNGWDFSHEGPKHANELLHWHAIRWARAQGATTYDFGSFDRNSAERVLRGAPLPDGFERTPHFFKLGFARAPILLPQARYVVPGRFTKMLLQRSGLADRAGQRLADRFRNG
jgi:lipid II:glycine glycyltransferase (peptidoglycan interpeptide bridge formation enzyme)